MRNFIVKINGKTYNCEVEEVAAGSAPVAAAPAPVAAVPAPVAAAPAPVAAAPAPAAAGGESVVAPLPGTVLRIEKAQGAAVKKGDVVVVLEAMKMENEIFAPCAGTVTAMTAVTGAAVNTGDPLFTIG